MTIITDDLLCSCNHPVERIEGRILVCAMCSKPKRLPFCVDCKYYKLDDNGRWETEKHKCTYPMVRGLDLVTGEHIVAAIRSAQKFRQDEANSCGIRARYFEHRDK